MEIQKLHKNAKETGSLAEEQFSKCRAAKELVKSIIEQVLNLLSIAKFSFFFFFVMAHFWRMLLAIVQ